MKVELSWCLCHWCRLQRWRSPSVGSGPPCAGGVLRGGYALVHSSHAGVCPCLTCPCPRLHCQQP